MESTTTETPTTTMDAPQPLANGSNDGDEEMLLPPSDDPNEPVSQRVRTGTISSARFNILSTMVGGGCLSLPLAFQESGNGLIGPMVLIVVAMITDFCFRLLVASSSLLAVPPNQLTEPSVGVGTASFESIAAAAFGPSAYVLSMGLVTLMCFFGTVGYSVLLRDMLRPITDFLVSSDSGWLGTNSTMLAVIILVTPLCTLQTLTALKNAGALSMTSILILGTCIVFRSIQCNYYCDTTSDDTNSTIILQQQQQQQQLDWGLDTLYTSEQESQSISRSLTSLVFQNSTTTSSSSSSHWWDFITWLPSTWLSLLNALPLYISCFVCHYNIPTVHNELQSPTKERVSWWLRSTILYSTTLYWILGFAGSMYGHCTSSGQVHGNVLLDFHDDDPLLMVGRLCLAITITLAFPMLTIPARDIVLRSILGYNNNNDNSNDGDESEPTNTDGNNNDTTTPTENSQKRMATKHVSFEGDTPNGTVDAPTTTEMLQEPLLPPQTTTTTTTTTITTSTPDQQAPEQSIDNPGAPSFTVRLVVAMCLFWIAGIVASLVESIDIVWDLLGSSLSILLSYLIPCGSYLVLTSRLTLEEYGGLSEQQVQEQHGTSRIVAWMIVVVFLPLMFVSTGNAIRNTFW